MTETPAQEKPKSRARAAVSLLFGVTMLVWGISQMTKGAGELAGKIDWQKAAAESAAGVTTFKSPAGDFTLDYPKAWSEQPKPPMIFHALMLKGTVNASVVVDTLPENTTLDAYTEATIDGMKKATSGAATIEKQRVTINGVPTDRISASYQVPSGKDPITAKILASISVNKGKGYVLTCTTAADGFAAFAPIFDAVIGSLKFSN
jgi:hypothetical protein